MLQKRIVTQRGISVLEVMLSLAIIAIILVMATRYYKSASQSQQVSNGLSVLHGIVAAETSYATANNNAYGGGILVLIGDGYLPKSLQYDPWGGQIGVQANTGSFTVTFTMVPSGVCNALTGIMQNEATISGNCNATQAGSFIATFS